MSSAGPNGAINHYRPDTQTNRKLAKGTLFLLDSGGQYLDGTTDVTRTIAIEEKRHGIRANALTPSLVHGTASTERITTGEGFSAKLFAGAAKQAEEARQRAQDQELRSAQTAWLRLGPVPTDIRKPLQDRFDKAVRRVTLATRT